MEPLYRISEDRASLHVSKGNSKIGKGIWSFSTLPGNAEHMISVEGKGLLTDIPGTCSRFCDGCFGGGCYAVRDAKLHHNATIPAWGENTLLLRGGRLWDELETFLTLKNAKAVKLLRSWKRPETEDLGLIETCAKETLRQAKELAKVKIFRIHVSGELEDAAQLRRWNLLALAHPETQFGIYTKNFDALAEFLDDGTDFAPNFVVNVSEWHGVAKPFLEKYSWAKLNVFEYCPSNRKDCDLPPEEIERLEKLPKCPAVTRSGHHAKNANGEEITCSMCGNCYRKTGRHIGVWSH